MRARMLLILFTLASFLASGMIFLLEPMVGKMLLPLYGGSAAVWNTCMMFYQLALLLGYVYSHVTTRRLGLRRQPWVHLAVLALPLLVLPVALPVWAAAPAGKPVSGWLVWVLVVMIGAPFVLLSTSGPLLQRWFAELPHPRAHDPYFLYAAGNAGSLLALLAYPLLVEPMVPLRLQAELWSAGYVGLSGLLAVCALMVLRYGRIGNEAAEPAGLRQAQPVTGRIGWRLRAKWLVLAFLPSSLMLGATAYLTSDVAAVPLLWVVPLAVYLMSFIVAFGAGRRYVPERALLLVTGVLTVLTLVSMTHSLALPVVAEAVLHVSLLACVALAAHMRLADARPAAADLTEYYLVVAAGGALGGVFNSLLAPVLFVRVVEYGLVLGAAGLALLTRGWRRRPRRDEEIQVLAAGMLPVGMMLSLNEKPVWVHQAPLLVWLVVLGMFGGITLWVARRQLPALAAGAAALAIYIAIQPVPALMSGRTFYGTFRVEESAGKHVIKHGSTAHGHQFRDERRNTPIGYYHAEGPAGDAVAVCQQARSCQRVGLVGLGAGTMAAYAREGDVYDFIEIDQAIVDIARDERYFSFLADAAGQINVYTGDGRLELAKMADGIYDLLVIDAFSSDAIPAHLITREAVELYNRKLAPGGMLAIHISNRNVSLEPVVAAAAVHTGRLGLERYDGRRDDDRGKLTSHWTLITADGNQAERLKERQWQELDRNDLEVWTDDYSSVLNVLNAKL